jgi:large subunit ribosomal protein L24
VLPDFARAVVEGVNRVKKHTKPNPMKNTTGGIVEKEMSIDLSNIAILNPATSKADRVGYKTLDDKRKVRVFRSNGEVIDA